ncbi:MAG: calcium/sodium antiporter [Ruminococcaceae bacterium]|nr:calcium/sodium antiporter [Oscillospiraceae bacterium]
MVQYILLFLLGLVLLIKGGDWFVDGSVGIARRFHLSEILIGATIVAIGTTLPEVMVSSISAIQGESDISYGNAIGSIICNTALISAITIAIRPGKINRKSLRLPVIFFFSSAILYCATAYFAGEFTRPLGIGLLAIFVVYMILSVFAAKKDPIPTLPEEGADKPSEPQEKQENDDPKKKKLDLIKEIVFLVLGAACIAVGAKLLVDNGIGISNELGVPQKVIALIFVALGTSLPELVTAITALAKGHSALSLGNIIGANLVNIVLVSGLSITLKPFAVPAETVVNGMNTSLIVDIPLMLVVMLILTVPTLIRGKLARWQGILLLSLYTAFCVFQFVI